MTQKAPKLTGGKTHFFRKTIGSTHGVSVSADGETKSERCEFLGMNGEIARWRRPNGDEYRHAIPTNAVPWID